MNKSYEKLKDELYLFNTGLSIDAYNVLGAHVVEVNKKKAVRFTVYAPNAREVFVCGDFSEWKEHGEYLLDRVEGTGCFTKTFTNIEENNKYKYIIRTKKGNLIYKADPFAFYAEVRPDTASIVYDIEGYKWHDKSFISKREKTNCYDNPINIYECSLSSFKQHKTKKRDDELDIPKEDFLSYKEYEKELIPYVKKMGYTHIEILPLMEHPFDGSWGYQTTGYYAITSRYGTPKDFMHFVDTCHKEGIKVILDWVPGHFCKDAHGLYMFDGGKVYDDREHKHWGTMTFDYAKKEVVSFLISNAMFFLDKYHVDGIRVDGVSSMLYLNYGVENKSEMRFNKYGEEGNLDAIEFLKNVNRTIQAKYKGVITIAEESTSWPNVTKPTEDSGLGFNYKWDMGWMHDTLDYMRTDFPYRSSVHDKLSFSMMYAESEHFILPLSHDEIVHGKCSILKKMPGYYEDKFKGCRNLYLYQLTHSGGKLNFMGNEFCQFDEWKYYLGLDFFLVDDYEMHKKYQHFVKEINKLYLSEKSLWELDNNIWQGFKWLDANDRDQNIYLYERIGKKDNDRTYIVINFSTNAYNNFKIGVEKSGEYGELINTNYKDFGGDGTNLNKKNMKTKKESSHGLPYTIEINIPALSSMIIKKVKKEIKK